ncbi:hypothetical protein ACG02S_00105 [Roseateles sp. DC23W]|uniref:Uncharacterized protein n=1 Tax=Pelomonas dachongensis TaxID=3299029 RepID=A0ABW7EFP8_9BURK
MVAAVAFGGAACAARMGLAMEIAGVLLLALNLVGKAKAISIVRYWRLCEVASNLRRKQAISIAVPGVGLLLLLLAVRRTLRGDAKFANAAEIGRSGLSDDNSNGPPPSPGRLLRAIRIDIALDLPAAKGTSSERCQ